jgi:hypothetical protein
LYVPSHYEDKPTFLVELHDLQQVRISPWLLAGDFNMIYHAQDKSNDRLNICLMGQFRRFLNDTMLQEDHLNGRLFTWRNECEHPTLERIDHSFFSNEWAAIFPGHSLDSLASLCSDHASLLLRTDVPSWAKKWFHFRSIWTKFPGFLDVVDRAWHCSLGNINPFARLDWLLHNTACFLKSWSDRHVGNIKSQLDICREVVHRLEVARDSRQLMAHEEHLWRELKLKSLALSSLSRTIARQESRITWIKEGDAPTHFFHTHANAHCKKKVIQLLHHNGETLVDEDRKATVLFSFLNEVLGTSSQQQKIINLELLDIPQLDLSALSEWFTEEEILGVICSLPPDKAPGLDGFTARFL